MALSSLVNDEIMRLYEESSGLSEDMFGQILSKVEGGAMTSDTFPVSRRAVASFQTPGFPAADVLVEFTMGGYRIVVAGKHRSAVERSSMVATANAKALHERLVAALEKDRDDRMPTWGAF